MKARPSSVGRAIRPTTKEIAYFSPDTFVRCCFAYTLQFGLSERSSGLWQHGSVFT